MENIFLKDVFLKSERERKKVENFLKNQNLEFDKDIDHSIIAVDTEDNIVGTGSISKNVLKCIAVDSLHKGEGISNKIVSYLIEYAVENNMNHLFIFTKPENRDLFLPDGFEELACIPDLICLLDNNMKYLENFLNEIKKSYKTGKIISSIVMNCNPFTLGHRYLIEKASKESDCVHLFLVKTDRSVFPYEDRYNMVKLGISDLENVNLHPGSEYIISEATFPTYFLKDEKIINEAYSKLDITIFLKYIVPALNINRRYVGTEPNDIVTAIYNQNMKEILPKSGVEVIELDRLQKGEDIVSASYVRQKIKAGNIEDMKEMVPESTYRYLKSEKGEKLIKKIQNN